MIPKKAELEAEIMKALHKVKDPEIDRISIVELGMVDRVESGEAGVAVYLLPTFLGCPALDIIKQNVKTVLLDLNGIEYAEVHFRNHPPWTSDRISEEGRLRLLEFGIAPPPIKISETGEWQVNCPYCDSAYTTMENLFGPTACRSILYCKACKNPFEAMKPISTLM